MRNSTCLQVKFVSRSLLATDVHNSLPPQHELNCAIGRLRKTKSERDWESNVRNRNTTKHNCRPHWKPSCSLMIMTSASGISINSVSTTKPDSAAT